MMGDERRVLVKNILNAKCIMAPGLEEKPRGGGHFNLFFDYLN